jgi:hypothetical protein
MIPRRLSVVWVKFHSGSLSLIICSSRAQTSALPISSGQTSKVICSQYTVISALSRQLVLCPSTKQFFGEMSPYP